MAKITHIRVGFSLLPVPAVGVTLLLVLVTRAKTKHQHHVSAEKAKTSETRGKNPANVDSAVAQFL